MALSVSQNTTLYTAASVLQKIVSFVYFTIVARLIGVENTGQYFFAISFTTVFTVMADFGFAPIFTREASRYIGKIEEYFSTVFWTKILFGAGAYGLIFIAVTLLGYDATLRNLILFSGVTMFFDNLQGVFFSVFRAKRNLWFESAGIVLSQVITMGVGLTALSNGWPLTWLILAYTIASGCVMLFGAFSLRRVYGFVPHLVFDTKLFKTFFVMAVPFGLAGIVGRFYSYADSMLMSKMLDAQHLGWWSVPYKMTFAFQFIPVALSTSLYAVFSALSIDNTKRIAELYEKGWQYLFIVSLPLAVGLSVVAEPLVVTLYSDKYLPSVPVLRILLVSLVFGYLTFVTGAALNATNNQKKQTLLLTATLVLNITLNILLIPRLTILGSAISALIGNIFLATVGFILLRRVVPVSLPRILARFTATLVAAVAMGVVVYGVLHTFSFIPAIISGLIVYPLALYIFGGVTKEDIAEFRAKLFPAKKIV